ncbi:MAG TPA: hypothetical protein VNQ73_01145 [Ilumatobacter sp.]|nr:hypothetical protein [Ilumatobacter sp.]
MRARKLTMYLLAVLCVLTATTVADVSLVFGDDRLPGLPGGGDDEGGGGGEIDEDGNPTAVAAAPGTPGGTTPEPFGDGESECWWEVVVADDTVIRVFNQFGERRFSATGRWLMRVCEGIGPVAVDGATAVPEGGGVDPGELAAEARESVPIAAPLALTSPASGRLVVRMPTWLWVDGGWWQTYSATATAGRVSSTVTATPTRAVWSTGDGRSVECEAGTPWRRGLADSAATCAHTYTTASPAEGYDLSVTVEFEVAWSSNVGQAGTLPTITRSASQTVQVGEIQAIGTR